MKKLWALILILLIGLIAWYKVWVYNQVQSKKEQLLYIREWEKPNPDIWDLTQEEAAICETIARNNEHTEAIAEARSINLICPFEYNNEIYPDLIEYE